MRADAARRLAPSALAFAVAAGLLAACASPTAPGEAPAYDPSALTGGRVYHWPLGHTVTVFVQEPGGSPGATPLAAHVRQAADAWLGELRYRELSVALVERAEDADVVVGIAGDGHPVVLDACGAVDVGAGFTLLCPDGDAARTLPLASGAPGRARLAIAIGADLLASETRLAAVVAHEVGHALGVGGHSADATDLMFVDPRVRRPSARDAATLRYVLHRPAAIRL